MQYSQEHLKTMVYAEFRGQTECIMGNSKIENCNLFNTLETRGKLRRVNFCKDFWECYYGHGKKNRDFKRFNDATATRTSKKTIV